MGTPGGRLAANPRPRGLQPPFVFPAEALEVGNRAGKGSGLVFSAAGSEAGLLQEALDPLQDLWLIDAVGEARAGAVPVDHKRVHRQNGRPVQHRAARITKAQATLVGLSWVAGQLQVEALRVAALEADELDSGLQPLDLGDLDRPHV